MTDIVERLRLLQKHQQDNDTGEAADTIEALRAENAKLQHVLKLALEYWAHRQQRYKNRHPAWVIVARAMMGESDD